MVRLLLGSAHKLVASSFGVGPILGGLLKDFWDIKEAFAGAGGVMLVFSIASLLVTKGFDADGHRLMGGSSNNLQYHF